MNPNNEKDRTRLFRAMEHSYRQLRPFRLLVGRLVEEYAGSGYGHQTTRPRFEILLNLVNQAVDAYTMSLAANRPRVLITTKNQALEYFAKHFEVALNNLIVEIDLESTLRQAVLGAFFCLGIVKIHLAESMPVMVEQGLRMDPGKPFASCVALDNWVHDMSATRWDQVKFAGDSYRIPFEDLKSDVFDQGVVRSLSPTSKYDYDSGDERLEMISRGELTDRDEYEPMVDLMDVWVPRDRVVYTFPMDPASRFSGKFKPIADLPYGEIEYGPYHHLGYNDVPENIMPTSPALHLAGLARLANNLMRKQSQRARAQKDVHTYTPAGAQSAQEIQRAGDEKWVQVQDPREIGLIKVGGVDPSNQAFLISVIEMYDRMAGNLSAMMGLGPQADTLGQERLIYGAVSKKEAHMQARTLTFANGVVRDLGFLLWEDAVKVLPGQMSIEGADGYAVDATWRPEDREGLYEDYQLDVDVFSMPYQSPAQRVQAIDRLITGIYAPLSQALAQQGGQINFQKLTEIYADLLNMPRLRQIVQFANAPPEVEGGASETTRNYVRRNVPTGGTQQGRQHVQEQSWLNKAGQVNPAQEASLHAPA